MSSPSPGQEIVRWHQERQIFQETGGDLNAYRERLREELRQEMANGGQPTPRAAAAQDAPRAPDGRFAPRHEVRLPTSTGRLNGSTPAANDGALDGSEEAIFEDARPRRR
jgi:hypothetical protein